MDNAILTSSGKTSFTYVGDTLQIETTGSGVRHRQCIPFDSISSLETKSKKHWWILILAIGFFLAGLYLRLQQDSYSRWSSELGGYLEIGGYVAGAVLLVVFFVVQPRVLVINAHGYLHTVNTASGRGLDDVYTDVSRIVVQRNTDVT